MRKTRMKRALAATAFLIGASMAKALVFETPQTLEGDLEGRDLRLDLGGRRFIVGNWTWGGWNGYAMALTNGTMRVDGRWSPKHGRIDLFHGTYLKFASEDQGRPAGEFNPGGGDAQPRRTFIHSGATLDLNGARFTPFNGAIDVAQGGTLKMSPRHAAYTWKGDFPVKVAGTLEMPAGFVLTGGTQGAFRFEFLEGSATTIGGDFSNGGLGTRIDVVVRGGTLRVTEDSNWEIDSGFVDTNATWRVDIAKGKICDLSTFVLAPGAKIVNVGQGVLVRSHDDPVWKRNEMRLKLSKVEFKVGGDAANRCYFIEWPERFAEVIKSVTYHCPDNDTVVSRLPYFHRRYPDNGGRPFVVQAVIEAVDGTKVVKNIPVAFNPNPIGKPAPNEEIYIGMVSLGPGHERFEMITNELANLYVCWGAWDKLLPEKFGETWLEAAKQKGIRVMTIYEQGCPPEKKDEIKAVWGRNYLGNSIGEATGFLYGAPGEMRGPQRHGQTLSESREWFVSKFIRPRSDWPRNAKGRAPFHFATSGAAFASYEMEGGIDFVCSELYAVGCGNLTYAQSEARGAARRWGPEWLCGWLAHEWQTFGIPYEKDDKYLSLEAGLKSLYLIGTSLMCLESGSSGTQAHPHTWGGDRDPDGKKHAYTYPEDPPRRYRETIRKVYQWVKANPRDTGLPETKIALALGGGDGYIGFAPDGATLWGQHTNRLDHASNKPNIWAGSDPERNWDLVRGVFFPGSGTVGVSGTPYGQVDVMVIDDQSRLRDIERYDLIVFGGWNTMTPRARDVLLAWVAKGGTLAIARPQLTTRDDRDFVNYTEKDLLPLWTGKGIEIEPGIEMKRIGKGEIHLSTARDFPAVINGFNRKWEALLKKLAARIPQRMTIGPVDGKDETRFFAYAVYPKKTYLLNLDMHEVRTVKVNNKGKVKTVSLSPLEVRIFE